MRGEGDEVGYRGPRQVKDFVVEGAPEGRPGAVVEDAVAEAHVVDVGGALGQVFEDGAEQFWGQFLQDQRLSWGREGEMLLRCSVMAASSLRRERRGAAHEVG